VALIAKTAEPHPALEGTVYTAAAQIEAAGGRALPVVGDIRDEAQVAAAGVTDFDRYAYQPGTEPEADLFVDHA